MFICVKNIASGIFAMNKMFREKYIILLVIAVQIVSTKAIELPPVPCPNIFHYSYNATSSNYDGILSFEYDGSATLSLSVNLTVDTILPQDAEFHIDLLSQQEDFVTGNNIGYQLLFPKNSPVPVVTAIKLNNKMLCYNNKQSESKIQTVMMAKSIIKLEKVMSTNNNTVISYEQGACTCKPEEHDKPPKPEEESTPPESNENDETPSQEENDVPEAPSQPNIPLLPSNYYYNIFNNNYCPYPNPYLCYLYQYFQFPISTGYNNIYNSYPKNPAPTGSPYYYNIQYLPILRERYPENTVGVPFNTVPPFGHCDDQNGQPWNYMNALIGSYPNNNMFAQTPYAYYLPVNPLTEPRENHNNQMSKLHDQKHLSQSHNRNNNPVKITNLLPLLHNSVFKRIGSHSDTNPKMVTNAVPQVISNTVLKTATNSVPELKHPQPNLDANIHNASQVANSAPKVITPSIQHSDGNYKLPSKDVFRYLLPVLKSKSNIPAPSAKPSSKV